MWKLLTVLKFVGSLWEMEIHWIIYDGGYEPLWDLRGH